MRRPRLLIPEFYSLLDKEAKRRSRLSKLENTIRTYHFFYCFPEIDELWFEHVEEYNDAGGYDYYYLCSLEENIVFVDGNDGAFKNKLDSLGILQDALSIGLYLQEFLNVNKDNICFMAPVNVDLYAQIEKLIAKYKKLIGDYD